MAQVKFKDVDSEVAFDIVIKDHFFAFYNKDGEQTPSDITLEELQSQFNDGTLFIDIDGMYYYPEQYQIVSFNVK